MTHQSNSTLLSEMTCTHPANDLIEAVAFGFATNEERRVVLNHVDDCAICATALDDARFAAMVLPLSTSEPDVDLPESVWAGIENRIAPEAVAPPVQTIRSPTSVAPAPLASPAQARVSPFRVHWAVAAVLALLTLAAGVLLGQTVLDRGNDEASSTVAEVTVTDPGIGARGTVEYVADQGVVVLRMDDMPPAPDGYVYQVWVIDGETPVPVGTMDPQRPDFATAADPEKFQTLAVTLEKGPIGSDLPTTDPIVVADLTQFGGD